MDLVMSDEDRPQLRRGWTTGACATAAARAAYEALVGGAFPDPVSITLPNGAEPAFALACVELGDGFASAGVIKDAGDDPDVTHGALILATVRLGRAGEGVSFKAGRGVGTVTRPGLALAPGEPAINPVPRDMMRKAIAEAAAALGGPQDIEIEISVPDGEKLAERTLNARLGVLGGLSILGTTGVVIPFSCAAWISSIHRGIDVARAVGADHLVGATGDTSEKALQAHFGLPDVAMIEMGDFVGGMLKYLRQHPVRRITVGGGFAKMTKLGQGMLDLHSKRGSIDLDWLAERALEVGASQSLAQSVRSANTANEALDHCAAAGVDIAAIVARHGWSTAAKTLAGSGALLDIAIVNRHGEVIAVEGPAPVS